MQAKMVDQRFLGGRLKEIPFESNGYRFIIFAFMKQTKPELEHRLIFKKNIRQR
jgi:hypothetical protein